MNIALISELLASDPSGVGEENLSFLGSLAGLIIKLT